MIKKQIIKKGQIWKSIRTFHGSHVFLVVKSKNGSKWIMFNGKENHKMKPQVISKWYTLQDKKNVR